MLCGLVPLNYQELLNYLCACLSLTFDLVVQSAHLKNWLICILCVNERMGFKFGSSAVYRNLPTLTMSDEENACDDSPASQVV